MLDVTKKSKNRRDGPESLWTISHWTPDSLFSGDHPYYLALLISIRNPLERREQEWWALDSLYLQPYNKVWLLYHRATKARSEIPFLKIGRWPLLFPLSRIEQGVVSEPLSVFPSLAYVMGSSLLLSLPDSSWSSPYRMAPRNSQFCSLC